jgi:antitoxin component YwqK of YwqJK toxin-antitoxin module
MPIIKARSSSLIQNVDLRGTPTAPTANRGTATTQLATTGFVGNAVSDLIDSAPNLLDTLNELALAINDDASFATTVTNSIATKVALAGDTMTGFLTLHADPSSNMHAATKQYVDAATLAITINSTDDVTEGLNNLYYTDTRVRSAVSLTSDNQTVLSYNSATGAFTYSHPTSDGVLEGSTNQYYTDARARASVSLTSDDSTVLSYSSATGAFTFTKQDTDKTVEGSTNLYFTTARARQSISAGSNISYDSSTGVISSTAAVDSVNGQTGVVVIGTDDVAEGSTNLYFTSARAAASVSLTTNDQNMLSYNSGTGAFTFVKPSTDGISEGSSNLYFTDARARAAMSVSGDLTYNSTTGVVGFALSNHDTDDLAEGVANLYYADGRARSAISLSTDDGNILAYDSITGTFTFVTPDTDSIDEGSNNLYYTDTRVRSAVGAIDAGGDGSFSYNPADGQFTYTGPSDAETRAHFSANDAGGDGSFSYDSSTGVFTYTGPSAAEVRSHISVFEIGSGDGSLTYDSSTGVISYTGPSAADVRAHFGDGQGISYNSASGVFAIDFTEFSTSDVVEGGNLYHTVNRVRAAISASTGVTFNSGTGEISIGQPVAPSDNVTFADVTVNGNLTVTGTTTTINTETIELADNIIVLNSNASGAASQDAGIEVERGSDTNVTLLWDEANNKWTIGSETFVAGAVEATTVTATTFVGSFTGQVTDISNFDTDDLAEGAGNLYFTDARARNSVSVTDVSGDGSLSYNSSTGVITYTGPSASEVRAHLSANDAGGDGSFSYDSTSGVFTYTGPSAAEARAHFSANDAGGDGSFSYDSTSGVFSYTGPSSAEARAHFSANDAGGDGSFSYDSASGVFSYTGPSAAETRAHFSATGDLSYNSSTGVVDFSMSNHDTGDLAEGTNLYYTDTRVRNAVSLTTDDATVMAYDATTGAFTFDLGNTNTDKVAEGAGNLYFTTARARQSISAGSNISYDSSTGVISSTAAVDSVNGQTGVVVLGTDDVAEGSTNLYYTNARAQGAISLTTDDSNILAYNSGTGAFTFTTPNTDSIDEGAVNLYYTNARADARIAAASVMDLADVDMGGATLDDGYTLVWSSAAQAFVPQDTTVSTATTNFTANGTDTSFSLGVEISAIENTTVFINGLYQAPTYSYTLSTTSGVTSVVFDSAPEANDVVTVRYVTGGTLNVVGVLNENSPVDGGSF